MRAALAFVVLLGASAPAAAQDFRFPSTCWDGCMVVTAYYDYGGTRDWSCGSFTYSGHRGTDFAPYGSFTAMDEGRDIVAAAAGEVIAAHDGEFDRCTTGSCSGGSGFGNYVAIRHDDGRVTYYAHMKRGTVAVGVGARVTCGQRLGQIGSSGYSTGPHLHFEPRVSGGADDPFGGVSGCSGPESWWVEQRGYRSLPAERCEETAPPPTDGAAVDSVEPAAGTHVAPSSTFTVRITMHNTGTTTWTDGDQHLLTFDGGERMEAPEQVRLGDASVGPDGRHTFEMTLRAPPAAGEYTAWFRMDRYGTARFGDRAEVRVVVDSWPDADGDGATADVDCDDADAARAPGATETCDGIDQDCDGEVDEGLECLPGQETADGGLEPALGDGGTTPGEDAGVGSARRLAANDARLSGGCTAAGASSGSPMLPLLAVLLVALRRRCRY